MTTVDSIRRWATERPDAPAFIADRQTLTYARLWGEIEGVAAALLARGVRPSVPVGLVIATTPLHLVVFLALLRLGVPAVSFAQAEPRGGRRALLDRVGAPLCLGLQADTAEDVPYVAIDRLAGPGDRSSLPPLPGMDQAAYFSRSSGTTGGVPKMVATTFGQVATADQLVRSRFPVGPADRYLVLVPITGPYGRYYPRYALSSGAAVIFPTGTSTASVVREAAIRNWATMTALTPPMIRDLLRTAGPEMLFPGMRVSVGTAPLSAAERRAAMARLSPNLFIGYGTSEVIALSMATPEDLAVDIETVGRTYAGIEVEAVDENLEPVPAGTTGTLRYRAAHFATNYVDNVPGATSRFDGGWFYPGDAGTVDTDGRIHLSGRTDDFLNIGGRKVHPGDIERILARHPAIVEVAVVPRADPRAGEVPVAAIVVRHPVDEPDLIAHCGEALPPRLRPRQIHTLSALPRNAAGKVDRRALIALLADPSRRSE